MPKGVIAHCKNWLGKESNKIITILIIKTSTFIIKYVWYYQRAIIIAPLILPHERKLKFSNYSILKTHKLQSTKIAQANVN